MTTISKELVQEFPLYKVYEEIHLVGDDDQEVTVLFAYNLDGQYIGNDGDADFICNDKGINPEFRTEDSQTCSIGFCKSEQKWYGWSHRAIYGYGIGSVVSKGDCTNIPGSSDPEDDVSLPIGYEAKTLKDARRMAIAFAESVS